MNVSPSSLYVLAFSSAEAWGRGQQTEEKETWSWRRECERGSNNKERKRLMSERKGERPERKENSKSFRDEQQEARARQEKRKKSRPRRQDVFNISNGGRRGGGDL